MGARRFVSPLGPKIAAYVDARRSEGCKFVTGADQMSQLDKFADGIGWGSDELGRELVEAFVTPRAGERPRTRECRASAVRCFGRYLFVRGEDAYVLPPSNASYGKYYFVPRLLTEAEVARLFEAADSMAQSPQSPLRHVVVPMLLRVTYCCGLRISEATGLLVSDVDLESGLLMVRGAKFNKDRRVPMSASLAGRCLEYAREVHRHSRDDAAFFPSPRGGCYNGGNTVGPIFRALLAAAGIPHYDDGPTLHSLRHSFAVHRLARWAAEGVDVGAMLPYLSAYMGHEGLLGTERYLRLTREMLPDLRGQIERSCSHVIPGVV